MVQQALKEANLEKVNQSNLLRGKTSEGGQMPLYSKKYRRGNLFYADYKARSNPLNRRRWDLKHWWGKKYDGLFYKSIKVKVNLKEVVFSTNYDPGYMKDIYAIISKSRIIGITKKQMIDAQIANKPKIKLRLEKLINKGQL
ncbi:MAG: hypothetical protein L0G07_00280 [Chryseobacterium sp.]|nr:hypothetical protein [Chryseobacterium sp.]MDN5421822.1 hypothetical protein [Chryseobacterium sp.]MDN5487080.1 hypothetical protein [Lactococcus lactis]